MEKYFPLHSANIKYTCIDLNFLDIFAKAPTVFQAALVRAITKTELQA